MNTQILEIIKQIKKCNSTNFVIFHESVSHSFEISFYPDNKTYNEKSEIIFSVISYKPIYKPVKRCRLILNNFVEYQLVNFFNLSHQALSVYDRTLKFKRKKFLEQFNIALQELLIGII